MERKKLALAPRSKPAGGMAGAGSESSGKPNPFGNAKPRAAKPDDYLSKEPEASASEGAPKPKSDPFGGAARSDKSLEEATTGLTVKD